MHLEPASHMDCQTQLHIHTYAHAQRQATLPTQHTRTKPTRPTNGFKHSVAPMQTNHTTTRPIGRQRVSNILPSASLPGAVAGHPGFAPAQAEQPPPLLDLLSEKTFLHGNFIFTAEPLRLGKNSDTLQGNTAQCTEHGDVVAGGGEGFSSHLGIPRCWRDPAIFHVTCRSPLNARDMAGSSSSGLCCREGIMPSPHECSLSHKREAWATVSSKVLVRNHLLRA